MSSFLLALMQSTVADFHIMQAPMNEHLDVTFAHRHRRHGTPVRDGVVTLLIHVALRVTAAEQGGDQEGRSHASISQFCVGRA